MNETAFIDKTPGFNRMQSDDLNKGVQNKSVEDNNYVMEEVIDIHEKPLISKGDIQKGNLQNDLKSRYAQSNRADAIQVNDDSSNISVDVITRIGDPMFDLKSKFGDDRSVINSVTRIPATRLRAKKE